MQRGEDLYHLDEGALAGLDADLVVTQDLCAVCAVDVSVVDDALAHLGCTAEVLTIDPHTLDEVLDSILRARPGHRPRGARPTQLVAVAARAAGRRRRAASPARPRPRVMLLEWTDPPFAPGPLGARDGRGAPAASRVLGTRGRRSPCGSPGRPSRAAGPDVVVAAPCGYDLAGATALADELVASGVLPPGVPVHAGRRQRRLGPPRAPASSTASRSSPPCCTRAERRRAQSPTQKPRPPNQSP